MRPLLVLALLLAAGSAASAPRAAEQGACSPATSEDRIAAIGEDGDLRLAGGRVVRLLDIRFAGEGGARQALAWLGTLRDEPVDVSAVGEPDRWGRIGAALVLKQGGIDVAELLVAEAFALVSSEERDALCRPALLALEAQARASRRGLWADPAAAPLQADDMPGLTARVGRFTLVEGRVRSVGERAQRSYLNFGVFGQPGFTVTLPKQAWSRLRSKGISADKLRGRRVRVRGVLESWRGIALEILDPSMLELLDDQRP